MIDRNRETELVAELRAQVLQMEAEYRREERIADTRTRWARALTFAMFGVAAVFLLKVIAGDWFLQAYIVLIVLLYFGLHFGAAPYVDWQTRRKAGSDE